MDSLLTEILLELDNDNKAPKWLVGLEPIQLIELLYRLEIIGIESRPRAAKGIGREWEGYDFVFSRPKGKPEQSASFLFHPGLWGALELM
jgi:hypothetical protein